MTDTWTQKADFRETARESAVSFAMDSKGYLGTVWDLSGEKKDFREYDPSLNTWTQKTDFDGLARLVGI